jgi:hypothetical protein
MHDLLAPCNSCLLVVLRKQPPVHFWLVNELPKLQYCLELCLFAQGLLKPGLQDGKCPFHWNGPENLIMTLIPTDGVLLKVRNQKERCHAWNLVAMTSHVWTLSMLFFQYSTSTSITWFITSSRYTTWPYLVCLQLRSDTLLASCYRQAITLSHPFVSTILVSHPLKLMTSFVVLFKLPLLS